jgi:hypothetical protein
MSFLTDKRPCKSCADLFDTDLLDEKGWCRDCVTGEEMYAETLGDLAREESLPEDYTDERDDYR